MGAITGTMLAYAALAVSAVGAGAQARSAGQQAKDQKNANDDAEERATVEAEKVQAAGDAEDTDVSLESDTLRADRAKQVGSRLRVGKTSGKKKMKAGVKL